MVTLKSLSHPSALSIRTEINAHLLISGIGGEKQLTRVSLIWASLEETAGSTAAGSQLSQVQHQQSPTWLSFHVFLTYNYLLNKSR